MRSIDCDILIIGSGAAGGTLAATLSEFTKQRIVVLERGGHYGREFFNQNEWDMRVLYAEDGARSNHDGSIAVRGGECVGGGTTVNTALCSDPVPAVWRRWAQDFGLSGFSLESEASDYGIQNLSLRRATDDVRRRIGVHPAAEAEINRNNSIFKRGCEALGITAKPFELNMRGCVGCGFCAQGCAYDAKQSIPVTYLSDALSRGVQLIHHADVEELTWCPFYGRPQASGAVASVLPTRAGSHPNSVAPGPLRVRARLTIVCAGAVETPLLMQKSGHPDPHAQLGRGLVLHPSLHIVGRMESEVAAHRGIESSVYSDHFYSDYGFYLESRFGHPLFASTMLPGEGTAHFETMLAYRKLAGLAVMLVDVSTSDNFVRWDGRTRKTRIEYRVSEADKTRMRTGAEWGVQIMFAGGAEEVILPSEEEVGPLKSPWFKHKEDATHCAKLQFAPHKTVLTSAHCQSTTRMSADPKLAMLSDRCESHFADNLMVVDSSAFPTSCGANPMLSIMALARYQGIRIAAELSRYGL